MNSALRPSVLTAYSNSSIASCGECIGITAAGVMRSEYSRKASALNRLRPGIPRAADPPRRYLEQKVQESDTAPQSRDRSHRDAREVASETWQSHGREYSWLPRPTRRDGARVCRGVPRARDDTKPIRSDYSATIGTVRPCRCRQRRADNRRRPDGTQASGRRRPGSDGSDVGGSLATWIFDSLPWALPSVTSYLSNHQSLAVRFQLMTSRRPNRPRICGSSIPQRG